MDKVVYNAVKEVVPRELKEKVLRNQVMIHYYLTIFHPLVWWPVCYHLTSCA